MEDLIKNLLPDNHALLNIEASLTPTLITALLFSVITIYVIAPRIEKLETDRKFYIGTLPWLISAGGLSALYASGKTDIILNGSIFMLLAAFLSLTIHIGKLIEKKRDIDKSYTIFTLGIFSSIIVISLLEFQNTNIFLETAAHIVYWLGPISIIYYILREKLDIALFLPLVTHLMDASSTVVSISNGAVEKQFIAGLFIELLGPHGIFILKTATIIPIIYVIDHELNKNDRNFYLYIITALGLVITIRNTLLAATGL